MIDFGPPTTHTTHATRTTRTRMSDYNRFECPPGVTLFGPPKLIPGYGTLTNQALDQIGFTGIEPPKSFYIGNKFDEDMDIEDEDGQEITADDFPDSDEEDEEFDEDGEEFDQEYDENMVVVENRKSLNNMSFKEVLRNIYESTPKQFYRKLSDIFDYIEYFYQISVEDETFDEQIFFNIYEKLYNFLCEYSLGSSMNYEPEWNDFSVEEAVRILNHMNDDFYENLTPNQMMRVIDFVRTLHEYLFESGQIQDIEDF